MTGPHVWMACAAHPCWVFEADVDNGFMGGFPIEEGAVTNYEANKQRYLFELLEYPMKDPRVLKPANKGRCGGPGIDELLVLRRLMSDMMNNVCGVVGLYYPDVNGKRLVDNILKQGLVPLLTEAKDEHIEHTGRQCYTKANKRDIGVTHDPAVGKLYEAEALMQPTEPDKKWVSAEEQFAHCRCAYIPSEMWEDSLRMICGIVQVMLKVPYDNCIIIRLPPKEIINKMWDQMYIPLCRCDWIIGDGEAFNAIANRLGCPAAHPNDILKNIADKMDRPWPNRVRCLFSHVRGDSIYVQYRAGDGHQYLPRPRKTDYDGIETVLGTQVELEAGMKAWMGALMYGLRIADTFEKMMAFASKLGTNMALNNYFDASVLTW